MGKSTQTLLIAVFLLAAAVLPALFASGYEMFQLTMVVVYAVAILGLNLVSGYNGQVSLGHGAFYAVGAYVTAILMDKYDVPYWATLPASAIICAGFGFLLGLPALRLGGLYLALTTFALAVAVPQLLKYNLFEPWTGGVQGIVIMKPEPPFGTAFWARFMPEKVVADYWIYLFCLLVGAVMFWLAANLVRGRIGRAMKAIRDHQTAAEAMGIDLAMFKTRTFAASAMFTGIAGSLGAIVVQFVAPDSFTVFLSITLFVGFVVGGAASIAGPIFGGIFVQFVPNIADQLSKAAPGAVYGVILIVMMFVMPGGVAGFLKARLRPLLARPAAPAPARPRTAI
jgi:branched-chain amino acid transport system permease protein